jgi:tellurite resistance protein
MISSVFLYFDLFLLLVLGSKIMFLPRCCPFRVTWWAVGFPMVAITIACIRYAENKINEVYRVIPGILLVITTGTVVYLLSQSIFRLATRQFLLSKPANENATQILEPLKQ